jgi:hypothetical protein
MSRGLVCVVNSAPRSKNIRSRITENTTNKHPSGIRVHVYTHTHTHTHTHSHSHNSLAHLEKKSALWPLGDISTLHLQIPLSFGNDLRNSVKLNFRDFTKKRKRAFQSLNIPKQSVNMCVHVCVFACVCLRVCVCVCVCVCEEEWDHCFACFYFINVHFNSCQFLPALPFWEKSQFSSFLKYHNICVSKNYYKYHWLQISSLISILTLSKFEKKDLWGVQLSVLRLSPQTDTKRGVVQGSPSRCSRPAKARAGNGPHGVIRHHSSDPAHGTMWSSILNL